MLKKVIIKLTEAVVWDVAVLQVVFLHELSDYIKDEGAACHEMDSLISLSTVYVNAVELKITDTPNLLFEVILGLVPTHPQKPHNLYSASQLFLYLMNLCNYLEPP